MDKEKLLEMFVSDTMIERPINLVVGEREFVIKPPTLGKMQVLSKYYLLLDIEEESFEKEPHLEAMRVCEAKTDVVCGLMAIAVQNTQKELLDDDKIKDLTEFFKWNAEPKDFADVILAIMVQVRYENFMTSIRLTKTLRLNKPTVSKGANRVE